MLMRLWLLGVSLPNNIETPTASLYVAHYTNYNLAFKLNFIFNWNPICET